MAKIEPGIYEPRGDDIRVFDGAEDDVDEEGSRLPLLIVIALLVLAAFAGVVYLAYTEGVQKGHTDAPRVITAQPGPAKIAPTDAGGTVTPYKGLKIYEQPAPSDEDSANADSVPPPPTEVAPAKSTVPATQSASVAAPPAAKPAAIVAPPPVTKHVVTPAVTPPAAKPAKTAAVTAKPTVSPVTIKPVVKPAASPALAATAPPRSLAPATIPPATKPAPVEAKPQPAAVAPAASVSSGGAYVLQIGSYKSEAEAKAAFNALKGKNGTLMSGFSPNVRQVDLGDKGTWYRLRVGSFADKDSAAALCQRLGGGCFPAKP